MKRQLDLLRSKVLACKEELFVKNIEINDLEEMEEVAEIAVKRCRNRLVSMQNRIQRRKEMLERVKHNLAKFENNTKKEEMQISDIKKSDVGGNITCIKSCQVSMDDKMQGLLVNLEDKGARIIDMGKRINEERRRLINMEEEIKSM